MQSCASMAGPGRSQAKATGAVTVNVRCISCGRWVRLSRQSQSAGIVIIASRSGELPIDLELSDMPSLDTINHRCLSADLMATTGGKHRTRPRHRERKQGFIETLIDSLTIDQLRTALVGLASGDPPKLSGRANAFDVLTSTGRSLSEIETALLAVESAVPTTHFFLARYDGEPLQSLPSKVPQSAWLEDGIEFTPVYFNSNKRFATLTFEHDVLVREWRTLEDDPNLKSKTETQVRHPLLLRLYLDSCIALICYPGFKQGSPAHQEDRLTYERVIDAAIKVLGAACSITFSSLPVQRCITALADANGSRVRLVKASMEFGGGALSLSSPAEPVPEYLAGFVGSHLNASKQDIAKAISAAITDANANWLVAHWLKEQVFTRIQFWATGAEFLFIWHDTPRTYLIIDNILGLVAQVSQDYESNDTTTRTIRVRSLVAHLSP